MAEIKVVCRFCLNDRNSNISLFNTSINPQTNLITMITTCIPVCINRDDDLPKTICFTCLNKIKSSYEFREMCLKNERILLEKAQLSEVKQESCIDEEAQTDEEQFQPEVVYLPSIVRDMDEDNSDADDVVEVESDVRKTAAKSKLRITMNRTKKMLYMIVKDPIDTSNMTDGNKNKIKSKIPCAKKEYACKICGKIYFYFRSYKHHIMQHRGTDPIYCETCGKSFMWKSSLKAHSVIHIGEKDGGRLKYSCETCGKKFNHLSGLKIHKMSHAAEKRSKCSYCKIYIKSFEIGKHQKKCRARNK